MPKFRLYCSWTMNGIVEVEAPDLDSAITDMELSEELPDGEYQDSSFEVVREVQEMEERIRKEMEGDGHER